MVEAEFEPQKPDKRAILSITVALRPGLTISCVPIFGLEDVIIMPQCQCNSALRGLTDHSIFTEGCGGVIFFFLRFKNPLTLRLQNNLPHGLPNKYSFHLWSLDSKETRFWSSLQPLPCPPSPKNWLFPILQAAQSARSLGYPAC